MPDHARGNQVNETLYSQLFPGGSHPYGKVRLMYSWSPNGCSYGAALGLCDSGGGGASSIVDQYVPCNKYFGQYGLTKKNRKRDYGGTAGQDAKTYVWDPYMKALGADGEKVLTTWGGRQNIVYILDDSGDKIGKRTRSEELDYRVKNGQGWPTTMTNGKVVQDSKTADGDDNTLYTLACKLTEEGEGKYGRGEFHNWFGEKTSDHDLAKMETHDRSDPYVVQCGMGTTKHQWVLLFWTETVTVGTGGALNGDFSDWNQVGNKNFCSSRATGKRKGINPYLDRNDKKDNDDRSALPNCVAYAWGILKQHGVTLGHYGDPSNWISGAQKEGFKVSTSKKAVPQVGAVAVFPGHVAVVAKIEDASHCTLIESDYSRGPSAKGLPYCRVQEHWENGSPINGGFKGYIYTGK